MPPRFVTTLKPSFTFTGNGGTVSARMLVARGPAGADGVNGTNGAPGATGPVGPSGGPLPPGGTDGQVVVKSGAGTVWGAQQVAKDSIVYLSTDYANIQAAITAAPAGSTVLVPPGSYTITTPLTISKALTVRGPGATITQTTAATNGITVTSSNVTLDGFTLAGTGSTFANTTGINVAATEAAIVTGLRLVRVTVKNWNKYAVYMSSCTGFEISHCTITNIGYGALMLEACRDGSITDNLIDTLTQPAGWVNSYGIAMGRVSTSSLAVSPRSARILCSRNIIKNVPSWEGIDTHGGESLTITDNQVTNCRVGIALVAGANTSGVDTYAPLNMVCSNNTVDSLTSAGTMVAGIELVGASDASGYYEYATGTVTGNVVIDYGRQNQSLDAAYLFYVTRGVTVTGNVAVRPSPTGFSVYNANEDMVLSGNTVIDAWTTALAFSVAVYLNSERNTVVVQGNRMVRGDKTATIVNGRGLWVGTAASNVVIDGGNDFTLATLPYVATDGCVKYDHRGVQSAWVGALPTRGVWQRGSQLNSTLAAASTFPGWVVTTAGGLSSATWAASTAYAAGAWVKTSTGKVLEVRTAGTSSASEPAPTVIGATATDGTVTWVYRSATAAVTKTMPALGA